MAVSDAPKSDSTLVLGLEADLAQPAKSRNLSRTRIGWADSAPGDSYQQKRGKYKCIDQTGRKRKEHDFCLEMRSGTTCLFCGKVRPWDPL